MPRLLAISDIHGSLPGVRALVNTEGKDYDAVVVAGDIGGNKASEFFQILDQLRCPVLYVYGNWDYQLEYDQRFGENTHHLHCGNVAVGDLLICGFSGCITQWGKNPAWLEAEGAVKGEHREILEVVQAAKESDEKRKVAIHTWYETELANITARTRDRRKRSFRNKLEALRRKCDRRIETECLAVEKVRSSKAHSTYEAARQSAWKRVQQTNRQLLLQRVAAAEWDPSRVVVVTHERLYRLNEDLQGLGVHLFGHIHGFKLTEHKGTKFVNVSSLDPWCQGSYVVMNWGSADGFSFVSKNIQITNKLLQRCMEERHSQ